MTAIPRRALAALPLAAASAAGLASCSGASADELTLWMNTLDDTQVGLLDQLLAGFAARDGGAVSVEQRSTDDHKTALRRFAGTYLLPDMYWYWEGSGLGGELVEIGMSRELTDFYEKYGWEDRFTVPSLAGITQYGGFHGVPWTLQAEGLYYNRELFAQAGITAEPTTYDELLAACDALVAAGITPIEFGGTVNWHVMRLLDCLLETTCGAELADSLTTGDADWSAQAAVTEAFTELKHWGDTYLNAGFMGISSDDAGQLFYNGEAAMALEGTWFNANVAGNGMDPEQVGIFPFPTGTNRLYGFGEAFYISTESSDPDRAAAFLDYITSVEGQAIAGSAWAAISVNKDVPVDGSNPLNGRWAEIFAQVDGGMFTNNDQNFSTAATTEFWRIQNSVLTGDMAPEDAGAAFQAFREQEGAAR